MEVSMSRSYRKRPFFSYTKSKRASEKQDKRIANKSLRAAFRQAFHRDPECTVPPLIREVSSLYNFASDGGAHWVGDAKHQEWWPSLRIWSPYSGPEYFKKMMRK
jgi:hypothetical protein